MRSMDEAARGLRRARFTVATLVVTLVLTAGCTSVPFSESLTFVPPPPQAAASPVQAPSLARMSVAEFDQSEANDNGEMRFQPGDTVKVAIWGYPELDHIAQVQPNGSITVPLVGELTVADRTAAQVRERVSEGLKPYTRTSGLELRPGDILHFQVWHEDSLRSSSVIDPSGSVTFPIAGTLRAAGRNVDEIRREAEAKIVTYIRDARVSIVPQYGTRRMLQDYTVSVLVQQTQPRRIAVIGEVGVQGMDDMRNGMRVLEVLAQHQVRQATARINSVVVIRNPPGGAPRYRLLRLGDYLAGTAPDENIVLRNGDIIIVPKTDIAKAGEFVELFLTRTLPVFQWWSGLYAATVAKDSADTVRLINDSLRRSLTNISVTPNVGPN